MIPGMQLTSWWYII